MGALLDANEWSRVFDRALSDLIVQIAGFLPNLAGALLILGLGWLVSRGIEWVASRILRTIGLDRAAVHLRIAELLQRAEIQRTSSQIVARVLFWLVMLAFVLSSVQTLGLSSVTATLDRLIAFIPNVLAALLIGVGGLLLGRLLGSMVGSAAMAAGVASGRRLASSTQIGVGAVALVVAFEQLGVDMQVLVLPVTVLLGASGFAVGLAFALGASPVITHILAGHFLKQSLPRDRPVEVDGRRGMVERVGAIDTLLQGEGEAWSIPNAQLLDRVVER